MPASTLSKESNCIGSCWRGRRAAILAAFFVGDTIEWPRSPIQAQAWVMARVVFAVVGIVLLARVIRWGTTECVLTNKRLVVKTGWMRRDLVEIWLTRIEGVQLREPCGAAYSDYATLMAQGLGGTRELHPISSRLSGFNTPFDVNLTPISDRD